MNGSIWKKKLGGGRERNTLGGVVESAACGGVRQGGARRSGISEFRENTSSTDLGTEGSSLWEHGTAERVFGDDCSSRPLLVRGGDEKV